MIKQWCSRVGLDQSRGRFPLISLSRLVSSYSLQIFNINFKSLTSPIYLSPFVPWTSNDMNEHSPSDVIPAQNVALTPMKGGIVFRAWISWGALVGFLQTRVWQLTHYHQKTMKFQNPSSNWCSSRDWSFNSNNIAKTVKAFVISWPSTSMFAAKKSSWKSTLVKTLLTLNPVCNFQKGYKSLEQTSDWMIENFPVTIAHEVICDFGVEFAFIYLFIYTPVDQKLYFVIIYCLFKFFDLLASTA